MQNPWCDHPNRGLDSHAHIMAVALPLCQRSGGVDPPLRVNPSYVRMGAHWRRVDESNNATDRQWFPPAGYYTACSSPKLRNFPKMTADHSEAS